MTATPGAPRSAGAGPHRWLTRDDLGAAAASAGGLLQVSPDVSGARSACSPTSRCTTRGLRAERSDPMT
ncbi:hypothetical protein, partial [Nonomuraea sp. NPDC050691]|uniref:hypothetical protein n=1 Tax=Nonomuraea sp. NPDC050691 TaxID=3155661 RepID=UPI0033C15B7B